MIAIVGAWVFVGLIYFKVALDSAFHANLTIFGAIILAITLAGSLFSFSGFYASLLLRTDWCQGIAPATYGQLVERTAIAFIGACLAFASLGYCIIFGFSKSLYEEMNFFNYRNEPSEDLFWCFGILLAPVLLHYLMSLRGTYPNANART